MDRSAHPMNPELFDRPAWREHVSSYAGHQPRHPPHMGHMLDKSTDTRLERTGGRVARGFVAQPGALQPDYNNRIERSQKGKVNPRLRAATTPRSVPHSVRDNFNHAGRDPDIFTGKDITHESRSVRLSASLNRPADEFRPTKYGGFIPGRNDQAYVGERYEALSRDSISRQRESVAARSPKGQGDRLRSVNSQRDTFVEKPFVPANTLRRQSLDFANKSQLTQTMVEMRRPFTADRTRMTSAQERLEVDSRIPGYTGHVPEAREYVGATYGQMSSTSGRPLSTGFGRTGLHFAPDDETRPDSVPNRLGYPEHERPITAPAQESGKRLFTEAPHGRSLHRMRPPSGHLSSYAGHVPAKPTAVGDNWETHTARVLSSEPSALSDVAKATLPMSEWSRPPPAKNPVTLGDAPYHVPKYGGHVPETARYTGVRYGEMTRDVLNRGGTGVVPKPSQPVDTQRESLKYPELIVPRSRDLSWSDHL